VHVFCSVLVKVKVQTANEFADPNQK